MTSNALSVVKTVRLFADAALGPEARSRHLATRARQERDDVIRAGRAAPSWSVTVDGRPGASEDTVKPDGVIYYQFSNIAEVIGFVAGFITARSPRKTGEFSRSWRIGVDGHLAGADLTQIPARSEIMLVNIAPWSRKVDVGAMPGMRVPSGIVETTRQAAARKFRAYIFERTMVNLPPHFGAGEGFEVPYILRGRQRSFAKVHSARIEANRGRAITTNRKDSRAGEKLTYPALLFRMRPD
jgi:hypothetical protein